ncbi:MAG: bifunctional helix-turn-helix transcriptional regulator/GNAT family N-acetyltransferase [Ottowia sp.]|uniref:bifunctional helix-turn-helix transcriptional regulator/GNAT family N-acetyltransferase n=1 Tax=Ottowia sp. TaxID=1898956 RepID=UPI0039E55626
MNLEIDPADVKLLRTFNRTYTQRIGVLAPYLDSPLPLTEVRILYELAHQDGCSAADLARDLGLDPGYLSRVLRRFAQQGWLARETADGDARRKRLSLTPAGWAAFEPLQQRSREQMAALLAGLAPDRRAQLVAALRTAQGLLEPAAAPPQRTIVLREPRPGDMGWVVQQHGALYAREFGWNSEFEALVAEIAARMIRTHDAAWERGFIAELDGERVGCAFVVRESDTVAKLRLVLVGFAARGLGLGARLTDECIAFARAKGYRHMVLWTNANLLAARAIYARRGFQLVRSEPYHGYGQDLVGEHWELAL